MTAYYTSGDIAKLCGVAICTVSNWKRRGNIPAPAIVTVGGLGIWSETQALQIQNEYHAWIGR